MQNNKTQGCGSHHLRKSQTQPTTRLKRKLQKGK
jgi:hypothetical protein